jgi:GNAT superfamily N-acetyltransferase
MDIELVSGPGADAVAEELLREYLAEVARQLETFDADGTDAAAEARDGTMLVAVGPGGWPVGCFAVRVIGPGVAELKRMYVRPAARGGGVGRALLAAAERRARELGCGVVRMDTAGPLTAALGLYRACGYRDIPRYNDNPSATHWLEKRLAADDPVPQQ